MLGTKRAEMYPNGSVQQSYKSLPFDDSLTSVGTGPEATEAHFTGQDHDSETNTDHFWARQYSPMQGRWMSPDPAGVAAVDPTNPQSWNRYAYVLNSPTNGTDPLGLYRPTADGGGGDPLGGGLPCDMCGGFGGPVAGDYGGAPSPTGGSGSMTGLLGQETQAAESLPDEAVSRSVTRFSFIAYGDTRGRRDG
jgi:RHS repeat-associated protein